MRDRGAQPSLKEMRSGRRWSSLLAASLACALPSLAHAQEPEPLDELPPPEGPPAPPPEPSRAEPPVVVYAPPPPAPAPTEPSRPLLREERAQANGGFELAIGTLFFQPSLADTAFEGAGTPLNGTGRESFRHKGRELGLESPLMWGGELSVHYLRRYFAGGVMMFFAGHPGGADAEPSPVGNIASSQVNPGSLTAYGGALDFAAALPYGIVAIRPGLMFGIRGFTLPLTGFEKTTCRGKYGRRPCDEQATTDVQLFVEPRVRVVITPSRTSLAFGGYVGLEPVGGSGPTAGLFVGFVSRPHEGLLP